MVPVRSRDEMGRLASSFNEMSAAQAATYAELQQTLTEREEQAQVLRHAMGELQQSQAQQARLLDTIREMSVPVVPVHQGVLAMPLVGIIDPGRAQRIKHSLLVAIEKGRARVVILDITGVPIVDTAVAQALLEAATAARLLGAEPVLVGIRPSVAETIVSLGVDLRELVTRSDLQSGVEYALRRIGQESGASPEGSPAGRGAGGGNGSSGKQQPA